MTEAKDAMNHCAHALHPHCWTHTSLHLTPPYPPLPGKHVAHCALGQGQQVGVVGAAADRHVAQHRLKQAQQAQLQQQR